MEVKVVKTAVNLQNLTSTGTVTAKKFRNNKTMLITDFIYSVWTDVINLLEG